MVGPKGTLKEGKAAVRKRSGQILGALPAGSALVARPVGGLGVQLFQLQTPQEKPVEPAYEEDGYLPAGDWPVQFMDPEFGPIG